MLNPFTLSQVVEKARHQEKVIDSWAKKGKMIGGRSLMPTNISGPSSANNHRNVGFPNQGNKLFETRRAQG